MGPGARDAGPPTVLTQCGTSAVALERTFPTRRRRNGRGHAKSATQQIDLGRRTRAGLRARGYHSAGADHAGGAAGYASWHGMNPQAAAG